MWGATDKHCEALFSKDSHLLFVTLWYIDRRGKVGKYNINTG